MTDYRKSLYRPRNFRQLGEKVEEREKAARFVYYDWLIWLPKAAVYETVFDGYCVPYHALENAKAHPSARKGNDAEEAIYKIRLKNEDRVT